MNDQIEKKVAGIMCKIKGKKLSFFTQFFPVETKVSFIELYKNKYWFVMKEKGEGK